MFRKKWLIPSLMILLIFGAVLSAYLASRPQGDELPASLEIQASKVGEFGVELDTAFSITTGWRVSSEWLQSAIQCDPELTGYTLTGGGKQWVLSPPADLKPNRVYTFQVKNPETGAQVQSFAFQTRSDLLFAGSYPADGTSHVSLDSTIELRFNLPGVQLEGLLEIKPEISGSFAQEGNTVIFQPNQPLEPDSIYRVTIPAGVAALDGRKLQEPVTFSFETEGEGEDWKQLRLADGFSRNFLPGEPVMMEVNGDPDYFAQEYTLSVYQYPSIDAYLQTYQARENWYQQRYGHKEEYVAPVTGLSQVAAFSGPLGESEWGSGGLAAIPEGLQEGWYLAELTGENESGPVRLQQLWQVSDLSLYWESTGGKTTLWLNDAATGEPAENTPIVLEDLEPLQEGREPVVREAMTDADGLAVVSTGESGGCWASVTKGGEVIWFDQLQLAGQTDTTLEESYRGVLYTDRETYRQTDTIQLWGAVYPRGRNSAPDTVWVQLQSGYPAQSLQRVRASVGADGSFSARLELAGMQSGWYTLAVTDGQEGTYLSRMIRVSNEEKPAYQLSVTTDRNWYTYGEPVTFRISGSYYDGTPAAGISLSFTGFFGEQVLTLDASGKASYTGRLAYQKWLNGTPGWQPESFSYQVSSRDEEQVPVYHYGTVRMLPSKVALSLEWQEDGSLLAQAAQLDTSKLENPEEWVSGYAELAGAPLQQNATVIVHRDTYIKIPDGTRYDPLEKQMVTQYRWERESRVVDTIQGAFSGGRWVIDGLEQYGENTGESYLWYELMVDGGVIGQVCETCYAPRGTRPGLWTQPQYTLLPEGENQFTPGEPLQLGLYLDGMPVENSGRVFYQVTQRRSLASGIFTGGETTSLTPAESWSPNVRLSGAYFDGRQVHVIPVTTLTMATEGRALQVAVTPSAQTVRPGESVSVTIQVTGPEGAPAAATGCLGVVDEAAFALGEQSVQLLEQLYSRVDWPAFYQMATTVEASATAEELMLDKNNPDTAGGGELGGQIREEFLDTALFMPFTTDETGKAVVEVALPDNVTGWRLTAVALSEGLKAGDAKAEVSASLPFWVQPLLTGSYLERDDLAVSVKSAGTALTGEETVAYTLRVLNTAGQELDQLTASGPSGSYTPLNFGKYEAGSYLVSVTGSCGEYQDTMVLPVEILTQSATRIVWEETTLEGVAKLPAVRYPVQAVFYDQAMQPYVQALSTLLSQPSASRSDRLAASWRAQQLWRELLPEEERGDIWRDPRLDEIQDPETGGVRALPVGEADPAVTARMLAVLPQLIDTEAAKTCLYTVLKDPAASQSDQVMAYLGLASLQEPVLLDVQRILKQETLSSVDQLYLGVALAKLGDYTNAARLYEGLSEQMHREEDLLWLEPDGSQASRLRATGAALMLTSEISHTDALPLMRYLCLPENERSRQTAVCNDLELLCFLERYQKPASGETAAFSWQDPSGQVQEVSLETPTWKALRFDRAGLAGANLTLLSGQIGVLARYEAYASWTPEPQDGLVTLEKTYQNLDRTEGYQVSDRVRVTLTLQFAENAPAGWYTITDTIPSGMRYLSSGALPQALISQGFSYRLVGEGQQVHGQIYYMPPKEEADIQVESASVSKVEPDFGIGPVEEVAEEPVAESIEEPVEEPAVDSRETPDISDAILVEEPVEVPDRIDPDFGASTSLSQDPRKVVLTYEVSCALPGRFVTEPAYCVPEALGTAAVSQSGQVEILARENAS